MTDFKGFAIAASLLALAAPTTAASNKDTADCMQFVNPDLQLAGCARYLQSAGLSNEQRSIGHSNRCSAFGKKRDFDHALAECDEAIRLNPKSSVAYNYRCNVLIHHGEYDRAIPD